jgi:hypothetical protein
MEMRWFEWWYPPQGKSFVGVVYGKADWDGVGLRIGSGFGMVLFVATRPLDGMILVALLGVLLVVTALQDGFVLGRSCLECSWSLLLYKMVLVATA